MDSRGVIRQFALIFVLTFALIFALLKTDVAGRLAYSVEKARLQALREAMPSVAELAVLSQTARQAAELAMPAVVAIETEVQQVFSTAGRNLEDLLEDGELSDEAANRLREWHETHPWLGNGLGSGFVIDAEDGLILTNHHVVENAAGIEVKLYDGRRYEADVVGADPETDLAVLRIDAEQLHEVAFGDSDAMHVGDDVLALGNPFGLSGTLSRGIVSARGRSNVNIHGIVYQGFLQTDAVINPGNSGGPLVNLRGEVVGVNTAIATRTGRYDGVGFAIPASRVQELLPRLIRGERIVRGFLGIELVGAGEVPRLAQRLGWTERRGVIIRRVIADSGAARAGLAVDDVLLELDGTQLDTASALIEMLAPLAPGTEVNLVLWRSGATLTLRATLGSRPS